MKTPHSVDVHVGQRVRMLRVAAGMSQERLGEALGVTFQQVQKYEKGVNRFSASRLFQTAQALGVRVSVLFDGLADDGAAAPECAAAMSSMMSSRTGAELCRVWPEVEAAGGARFVLDAAHLAAANRAVS